MNNVTTQHKSHATWSFALIWWLLHGVIVVVLGGGALPAAANEPTAEAAVAAYQANSGKQLFQLQWVPVEPVALNTVQTWHVRLNLLSTAPEIRRRWQQLTAADFKIDGGMPAHAHGLPTVPQVRQISRLSANGLALVVSGVKFQMWGQWYLRLSVPVFEDGADVTFELQP